MTNRHTFKASYSGMVCDQMVIRDGCGDSCGLTPDDLIHLPIHNPGPELDEVDPRLLQILKEAGKEWGPLGVARAAARLIDITFTPHQQWRWLESTKKLQEEAFGLNYSELKGNKLADYFVMNHTALVTELTEFMQEVGWKDWAQPRGWVNKKNALKELVDAAHFLSNLVCAIGVTDSEWEQAYQAKQAVNRERQLARYDGVTGKCPGCKRSYDDGIDCESDGSWCFHSGELGEDE